MSYFTEYQIEHAYTPYIDVNTGYNNSIAYVNRNPGIPIFDIIDLYNKKHPFNFSGPDFLLTTSNSISLNVAWTDVNDNINSHYIRVDREGIKLNPLGGHSGWISEVLALDGDLLVMANPRDIFAVHVKTYAAKARHTGFKLMSNSPGGGGFIVEMQVYMPGTPPYTLDLNSTDPLTGTPYIPEKITSPAPIDVIWRLIELSGVGVLGAANVYGPLPYKDSAGNVVLSLNTATQVLYCSVASYITIKWAIDDAYIREYEWQV